MVLTDAVQALQRKLVEEFHASPDLFEEIARMEALLAETYRDRFLYELLQNSDDAGSSSVRVSVESDGWLTWQNDGRPFTAADVESLCRSARSTKRRDDDFIGYRGIGFKSLAAVAHSIDVESAGAGFRFDRRRAAHIVGASGEVTMPLIRVPVDARDADTRSGARFTIGLLDAGVDLDRIDPLSMLFLRNVRVLELTHRDGRVRTIRTQRDGDEVTLRRDDDAEAAFVVRRLGGGAELAIPMNSAAMTLTGVGGRLCCFLPLADPLGIPCVVSGMVMTDPSRTHAVVDDPATQEVVASAARLVLDVLSSPSDPVFERAWELCLLAEDPRATLSSARASVTHLFWGSLRDAASGRPMPARYSPVAYRADEVDRIVPAGTPRALYLDEHRAAAKALKPVLALRQVDVAEVVDPGRFSILSAETRAAVVDHIRGTAEAFGRPLTGAEKALVAQSAPARSPVRPPSVPSRPSSKTSATPIASYMQDWRAAEKSVVSYLNDRGWDVEDVSQHNLGYDVGGRDPRGREVFIEVKKVDGPDSRFSVTNNEMSFLQSRPDSYLFAMVVGQGNGTGLYLIPGGKGAALPFERVCRRWDWECSDWARAGEIV